MEKKYQVFISSTYGDLKQERSNVMQSLLRLKCIPAGMELFPATNNDQWMLIKKVIEECDYYIVILGGRYGSINTETNLGFTEMEYDYACKLKKPILAFLHSNIGEIKSDKCETTTEGKERLKKFIDKIEENRHRVLWDNADNLANQVILSMLNLFEEYPAVGWIKADKVVNDDLLEQISRLNKENKELDKIIKDNNLEQIQKNKKYAQNEDLITLDIITDIEYSEIKGRRYQKIREIVGKVKVTWNELFTCLADEAILKGKDGLTIFMSERIIENYILENVYGDKEISNISETLNERERIGESTVNMEMFDIIRQFKVLGYIDFFGTNDYESKRQKLKLTEFGKDYYYRLTAIKKK